MDEDEWFRIRIDILGWALAADSNAQVSTKSH